MELTNVFFHIIIIIIIVIIIMWHEGRTRSKPFRLSEASRNLAGFLGREIGQLLGLYLHR
jgi:hypothetical protein